MSRMLSSSFDLAALHRSSFENSYGGAPWHEPHFSDYLAWPYAVHDQRKGRCKCRGLHRVPKAHDCWCQAANLFDRRSWTRSHCQEDQSFCRELEWQTAAVLSSALFA